MYNILSAKGITKYYKTGSIIVNAINDITLTINKGEIVIILGKSGSGKSTLLNILGGIEPPDSGDVFIDDQSLYLVKEAKRTEIRSKKTGFIFQEFNLINELTVLENIRLPYDILNKKYDIEYEKTLISMLDLETRQTFYPGQLSGGERQRTAIARALLSRPSIVFADEATGNIDTKAGQRLINFVKETNESLGQTYVIVTHDNSWIPVAHRILYMNDGKIYEEPV